MGFLRSFSREAHMPSSICFSYPENVPPDRQGPTNSACFGYSVGELLDQGGGKTTTACFSCQSDIPSGVRRMPLLTLTSSFPGPGGVYADNYMFQLPRKRAAGGREPRPGPVGRARPAQDAIFDLFHKYDLLRVPA
jgi:hypothetical protein